MQLIPLHPAYNEDYLQFFVDPSVIAPFEVSYPSNDRYERKPHVSQFLKVPFDVPNYLGLCQTPNQKPWGYRDEIDVNSIHAGKLLVSFKKAGVDYEFVISTKNMSNSGFSPSPAAQSDRTWLMNFVIASYPGFTAENVFGDKAGEDIFHTFKEAGYEPLFWFGLTGSFDRQLNNLKLQSGNCGIRALRHIETGEIIRINDASQEVLTLMKCINKVEISGVLMKQYLA